MKKLAIITTHPIQYHAPLYELLVKRNRIGIHVFYTWGDSVLDNKFDPGFGKVIQWDIPLLSGYPYTFLENAASEKGSHHFNGIINPGIIPAIEAYQPDAILVYGWSFKSHLQVLRHFKGKIPVIFRGDSTLLDKAGWLARIKRTLFLRWVYRYVDYAWYVGKNNADYFRRAGLKNSQLVFGPHAIDNDRFSSRDEACVQQAAVYRKQLGIPDGHSVFLFAGKLESKKAPDLLVQSFMHASMGNQVHLVLVGNGELEPQLKELASSHSCIHFLDFQNQQSMPALYRMADVFVLPSRGPGETWGLAVNEAMAAGKPVIVSDRCGCAPDLVQNGINGWMFESSNQEQLVEKMKWMRDHQQQWPAMGQESRNKISRYSMKELALSLENLVTGFS